MPPSGKVGDPLNIQVVSGQSLTATDDATATAVTGAGTGSAGAASAQIVAANTTRKGLSIVNKHATQWLYLGLGTAAVLNSGIALAPAGGSWDGKVSGVLWRGAVNGIADGATTTYAYAEV